MRIDHILQKNLAIFMLMATWMMGGLVYTSHTVSADGKTTMTPENIIALVNGERSAADLATVRENPLLTRAAQKKLDDMFAQGYFAHTSPDGVSPWHWFAESGYAYVHAGENLAMDFDDVRAQHEAWMASPTHRFNILSDQYDEVGIAVGSGVIAGETTTVAVQLFGSQTPVASAPTPVAPAPAQQRSWPVTPEHIAWSVVALTLVLAIAIDVRIFVRRFGAVHAAA